MDWYQILVMLFLTGWLIYAQIRLLNAKTALLDLQIKYKYAQKTIDAIVESRQTELRDNDVASEINC